MASEMVERVAREIWRSRRIFSYSETEFDKIWSIPRYSHMRGKIEMLARADIEAMREPTTQMLQDGHEAAKKASRGGVCGMTIDAQVRSECLRELVAWQVMIDESLK